MNFVTSDRSEPNSETEGHSAPYPSWSQIVVREARILDSFPLGNQPQIRQQLSLALLAVVAQQLVPAVGNGGRYPVVEILMATSGVRSLIRKGEDHQLYSALSTGRAEGMISMEQSLAEMVRSGRIHRETAMAHCFRPDDLLRYLQS